MENLLPTSPGVVLASYLHSALYLLLSATVLATGIFIINKGWAQREAPGGMGYVWLVFGSFVSMASVFIFILNGVDVWAGLGTLAVGVLFLIGMVSSNPKRRRRSSRGRGRGSHRY